MIKKDNKQTAIFTAILTFLYLGLCWAFYKNDSSGNFIADTTYYFFEVWENIGFELTACFVSTVLIVPTISLSSTILKKKYADRNIKATIILSAFYLSVSIFTTLFKPIASQLSQKALDTFIGKYLFYGLGLALLVLLVTVPLFFVMMLSDIYKIYKEDLEEEIKVELNQKVDLTVQ